MTDRELIKRVAALWIELGGDAEGMTWSWRGLRDEIERQISGEKYEMDN